MNGYEFLKDLYIVDWQAKGNVIRFYLGDAKQFEDSWGDDWDDAPYDDNAGTVYDEYYKSYIDIAWNQDYELLEPCSNFDMDYNLSKQDLKQKKIPFLVIKKLENEWEYTSYKYEVLNEDNIKLFLGDPAVMTVISRGKDINYKEQ